MISRDEPLDDVIIIRAPAERKRALKREAREAGKGLSEYVRDQLFPKPDPITERLRQNRRDVLGP